MAHVFIVNEDTFSIHLQYKFAGTGAKNYDCEYLINNDVKVNASRERLLTGMIADVLRLKVGDNIIFYLQQTKTHEGMFFGSFIVSGDPFICNDNYLDDKLSKKLIFRVPITENEVYAKGITERDCLDSLEGITHPSQMCWSLIYRKLKGNRGCTMITDYEYDRIMQKIRKINNNVNIVQKNLNYDKEKNLIIKDEYSYNYEGKKEKINIKDRLLYKKNKQLAFEAHLQAYILQNLYSIEELKVNKEKISWIGNEVSCGVGMQSIDICFIQESKENVNIIVCELKGVQPEYYIKNQISKYIQWITDYIIPTYNKKVIINPTIVSPKPTNETKKFLEDIKNDVIQNEKKFEVKPIRNIYFEEVDNNILFKEDN